MDEKQFKEFVEKFGKDAAEEMKRLSTEVEKNLNDKFQEVLKGSMKRDDFEKFKTDELNKINEKLDSIEKLEKALKDQGIAINELRENGTKGRIITLEQFIETQIPTLKELYKSGKSVEFTGAQLKAAGVTSISGSVQAMDSPPDSPYLPGIGGAELEMFDIIRNPNFITNRVDLGRTNQSRLAWINETDYQGTPDATVAEAGAKPLTQHKFKVEFSEAKKAAAYIELTEEFETDVPGLSTQVRRMLQNDVIRAFDDQIQTDVIAAARPFEITGLNSAVANANLYDAIGAMLAQNAKYNFISNTVALNPVTLWKIYMGKDTQGRYLTPPFLDVISRQLVEATKVAENYSLVGDMTQYKVDIYKDFVLKMGWINDQLIYNKFSIVGELRYHSYISDARKKAIVYDNLNDIESTIDSASNS
jgi:hypothetical protein